MIAGLAALLCGCKAHYPVAQESGKEDMAYLLLPVRVNMQEKK